MEFNLEGSFNLAVGLGVCNRILEGSIYFSELINLVRGGGVVGWGGGGGGLLLEMGGKMFPKTGGYVPLPLKLSKGR